MLESPESPRADSESFHHRRNKLPKEICSLARKLALLQHGGGKPETSVMPHLEHLSRAHVPYLLRIIPRFFTDLAAAKTKQSSAFLLGLFNTVTFIHRTDSSVPVEGLFKALLRFSHRHDDPLTCAFINHALAVMSSAEGAARLVFKFNCRAYRYLCKTQQRYDGQFAGTYRYFLRHYLERCRQESIVNFQDGDSRPLFKRWKIEIERLAMFGERLKGMGYSDILPPRFHLVHAAILDEARIFDGASDAEIVKAYTLALHDAQSTRSFFAMSLSALGLAEQHGREGRAREAFRNASIGLDSLTKHFLHTSQGRSGQEMEVRTRLEELRLRFMPD